MLLEKIDMPPPARILIIEDEEILADNLKTFLGRRAPDVRIAPDAETAMAMLKSFTPDLVLLDYVLPGIDGLSAYRNIVRTSPRQPGCIMISGYLTDLVEKNARQLGIRHLLGKPFSFAELQHEVDLSSEEKMGAFTDANRRLEERRSQQFQYHADRRCQVRRNQPAS